MTTSDDTAPTAAALTPDETLSLAIQHHQAGDLDAAERLYATLLRRQPGRADAMNFMGMLLQQRGQLEPALALLRGASQAAPKEPAVWNNLGNVLLRLDQVEPAGKAFRRSLALADTAEAHTNLARVQRHRQEFARAEASCRQALALDARFGAAWHTLSLVLLAQQRSAEAFDAAVQAELLLPKAARRRESYGRALMAAGEVERAREFYRDWLAREPDSVYARHHLAACAGEDVPERASDGYVEQVFDEFAASFDTHLATLKYRAPELVAEALAAALPPPARQFDVADIGCGTGLCGPLVRGWARRLVGCDLSSAMLDKAAARGSYDELAKAELVRFLQDRPEAFDVVVSADTLNYFGEHAAVFAAARAALRAGGTLVFTLEALPADDDARYRLMESGRYAHHLPALRETLAAAGLRERALVDVALRLEGGQPVQGWLVSVVRDR
ncbi:MAG: methyltransferase [Betaproteobacteria bacterium]